MISTIKYLILFIPILAICQSKTERSIELGLDYGKVLIHSKAIENVKSSNPLGISLSYFWRKTDSASFNKYAGLPALSINLKLIDFQNIILGKGVIAAYSIHPTIFHSKIIDIDSRVGVGMSYLNKYDFKENNAYSAPISAFLTLGVNANINLTPKLQLSISTGLSHISNGGVKLPNKGINWLDNQIAIKYYPNNRLPIQKLLAQYRNNSYLKKDYWSINFFTSSKNLVTNNHINKPIYGLNVQYSHQYNRNNGLTIGVEHFLDYAQVEDSPNTPFNFHKTGLLLGHEFLWGSVHFSQQFGIYLHPTPSGLSSWYHRWGLDIYLNKNIKIGGSLLAHGVVAYFPDIRLGYSF